MDRLTFTLAAFAAASTGCINVDVCVDGYTRASGRCVPIDAGSTDGAPTDGARTDGPSDTDGCTSTVFYRDQDEDTFGDDTDTVSACDAPTGYVTTAGDCDDTDDTIHPDAPELCNQTDDDCDVAVDEGLIGLLGPPRSLGAGRASIAGVAIAPYEAGYVVVWTADDGQLYIQPFSTVGAEVVSRIAVATPSRAGASQLSPELAVIDTDAGTRAVVLWEDDYDLLRARSFPVVDWESPSDAVTIDPDTGADMTVLGDRIIVVWFEGDDLSAAVLEPVSLSTITGPTVFDSPSATATLVMVHGLSVDGIDYVVTGLRDERAGDTLPTGYLRLFSLPTFDRVGAELRVRPSGTEAVFGMEGLDTLDGQPTLAVWSSAGDPGDTHFFDMAIAAETLTLQSPRVLESSGFPFASAPISAGIAVAHFPSLDLETGDFGPMMLTQFVPPAAGTTFMVGAADGYTGADLAYHPSGAMAIVYGANTESAGTTTTEVFFQRIGCE